MTRTHARTATTVLLVAAMLAVAVPAFAGQSVERPIRETLFGYTVGIEYAPNFPAHAGDTFGGRCSVPSQWISTMSGTGTISHLGTVSWTTEHCFQLFAGTFSDADLVITVVVNSYSRAAAVYDDEQKMAARETEWKNLADEYEERSKHELAKEIQTES